MHEWVVSFDLNSLYPHLIMQYNISPETIINSQSDLKIDKLLDKKYNLSKLKDNNIAINPMAQCIKLINKVFYLRC